MSVQCVSTVMTAGSQGMLVSGCRAAHARWSLEISCAPSNEAATNSAGAPRDGQSPAVLSARAARCRRYRLQKSFSLLGDTTLLLVWLTG